MAKKSDPEKEAVERAMRRARLEARANVPCPKCGKAPPRVIVGADYTRPLVSCLCGHTWLTDPRVVTALELLGIMRSIDKRKAKGKTAPLVDAHGHPLPSSYPLQRPDLLDSGG